MLIRSLPKRTVTWFVADDFQLGVAVAVFGFGVVESGTVHSPGVLNKLSGSSFDGHKKNGGRKAPDSNLLSLRGEGLVLLGPFLLAGAPRLHNLEDLHLMPFMLNGGGD